MNSNFYVYVYIDPRNLKEFYYGKGKGNRKFAHLKDSSNSEKSNIIHEIHKEGLEPIIKVVACGLTEDEALLIEKTLIWKLQDSLSNVATGHFSENFRPPKSFHKNIPGFDFENKIYYVNVGETETRNWDDCLKYGFLAAGQGVKWRDQILKLNKGDVVYAYLKKYGYVGLGIVSEKAVPIRDFAVNGKRADKLNFTAEDPFKNSNNLVRSDYLVKVSWQKAVTRDQAKWKANSGLFTTQMVVASLANQEKTINFLEKEFEVAIDDLTG